MRIAFIGCVDFSHAALSRLLELPAAEVVGIATRERSPFNADFRSLAPIAAAAGVPCLLVRGNDQAPLARWLREIRAEVVYCFGWSYLLHPEVLAVPPLGGVGWHPAALPRNRGRHPVIWALALGLQETASTFFFLDAGADSGDILSQVRVPIREEDDAASLLARLTAIALGQIESFTPQLAAGSFPRAPQDAAGATSWRRRGAADGAIDWRMSARSIHNLVRALTRPYVGAHCLLAGHPAKVWRTAIVESLQGNPVPIDAEPGKVLAILDGRPVVRCGEGAIAIVDHELAALPEPGSYL